MRLLPRFRLGFLARFSLVAFVITAAIAVGLAWGIEFQLEQNTLRQVAESAADQVATLLDPNLEPSDFTESLAQDRYQQIDTMIRQNVIREHIVRVKIWARDGLLLYSDEADLVGQRFPLSDELKAALDGKVAMEVSPLTKVENVGERGRFDRLLEVYIPLHPMGAAEVAGAYEIYHDLAEVEPSIARMRLFVSASVGLGFLILYGSLFTLARNASRELVQRNEENTRLYQETQHRLAEATRAEAERRASEARFAGVLDIAVEAIISMDEAQHVVLFNEGAHQIFGYSPDEVIGQSLDLLLPKQFAAIHRTHVAEFAASAANARRMGERREILGRRKSGEEFPAEASISKLEAGGERIFTVVLRDITERKRAEAALAARNDELRAMTQQLWQTAKLATMGELAASVAHELNNPLATVSLRLESLLAQSPAEDDRRRALEIVQQEVERMGALVASLLQFSRRNTHQISTLDLRDEIDRTLELIYYQLRTRGIALAREFASDLPPVQADRQQLRQLFLNLFTNAADAMPEGGTLTIRAISNLKSQTPNSQPAVVVEITDTGSGIAPEDLPKVMEPFFTTKGEGKGTGLGLAICRRIAEEHHGTLHIESRGPGKGATVRLTLPLTNGTNGKALREPQK